MRKYVVLEIVNGTPYYYDISGKAFYKKETFNYRSFRYIPFCVIGYFVLKYVESKYYDMKYPLAFGCIFTIAVIVFSFLENKTDNRKFIRYYPKYLELQERISNIKKHFILQCVSVVFAIFSLIYCLPLYIVKGGFSNLLLFNLGIMLLHNIVIVSRFYYKPKIIRMIENSEIP